MRNTLSEVRTKNVNILCIVIKYLSLHVNYKLLFLIKWDQLNELAMLAVHTSVQLDTEEVIDELVKNLEN